MTESDSVLRYELNGRAYAIHKLPATKAVKLATRLSRLFGDALLKAALGAATTTTNGDQRKATLQLGELVDHLHAFEGLDDDAILDLQRAVFQYVWLDKQRLYMNSDAELDAKFEGYELDSLMVLWEAIKFNLSPFFNALRSRSPIELATTA